MNKLIIPAAEATIITNSLDTLIADFRIRNQCTTEDANRAVYNALIELAEDSYTEKNRLRPR